MTRCTTELFVDHSKSFRKKFFRKDINIIQLNFVIALIFALITFFLLTIPYFGMITIVSSLQLTMDYNKIRCFLRQDYCTFVLFCSLNYSFCMLFTFLLNFASKGQNTRFDCSDNLSQFSTTSKYDIVNNILQIFVLVHD